MNSKNVIFKLDDKELVGICGGYRIGFDITKASEGLNNTDTFFILRPIKALGAGLMYGCKGIFLEYLGRFINDAPLMASLFTASTLYTGYNFGKKCLHK